MKEYAGYTGVIRANEEESGFIRAKIYDIAEWRGKVH
jgi:hypothetical protein